MTLVRVELHSDVTVALRVRVSNELDGPVLPPRRAGAPAAGWDAEGFSGVVPPEGRLGVGYACPVTGEPERPPDVPAESDDPVVDVDVLGPADSDVDDGTSDPIAAAVRDLGRATPPADAVPTDPVTNVGPDLGSSRGGSQRSDDDGSHCSMAADALPDALSEWLDAVETRVQHAERLTDASVSDATETLETCGGADGVADLPASLAADLTTLRAAAARIDDLATRAEATEPDAVVSALADAAESRQPGPHDRGSGDR
ncbi:hypothetical protein DVK02_08805 [Halobellus sp. Atlit-31R]|nr:hypothetical protein DVK02_08805 [Halobellus sp. Atlit-31R]